MKKTPKYISCTVPKPLSLRVTLLGVVLERGGQLNGGPILLHYRLQTTVYNSSIRTYETFPVTAYFKNGQRWANFPLLSIKSYVFLIGRIFGLTKKSIAN
jgi:hypothetical protein